MIPTNQMWKYISKLNDYTMLHRPTNYNKNWNPRQKVLYKYNLDGPCHNQDPRITNVHKSEIEPCERPLTSFPQE